MPFMRLGQIWPLPGVDSLHKTYYYRKTFKLPHWLFVLMQVKLSRSGERLQGHNGYNRGSVISNMHVPTKISSGRIKFSFFMNINYISLKISNVYGVLGFPFFVLSIVLRIF